ncbi:beta strand repeat-containing protein [Edaphobacter modestus]|uniref:beta strand repeat-containing protein n=1 Tax=Edaphobacter modestus TaxID=388466 RepID=UPI0013EEA210|nr:putative Ig domain-containing protein [Edaphobacter modestus]
MAIVITAVLGSVLGCASSGASSTSQATSPAKVVYPQTTITAAVGQAITADTPTVTGTATSYAVSPALPAGLSLNTSTGAISGTPTAVATQATYTITASNSAGSTSATIQVTVNSAVVPPSNLVYPQTTITAAVGQAITADTPTVTGTATSYAVSPALPAGLSLNTSTGAISGMPTAAAAQATYTITASNSAGSTSATIQITVSSAVVPPSSLVYPQTTITATVGQAITADTPTLTGTVTSYAVSPALPAGLSLSTSTGVISGTPTTIAVQAPYTVTASNSAGSTSTTIQIAVNAALALPSNLTYPQTTIIATVGQAIISDIPGVTGTVTSYAATPALPAGLSLSSSTGAISGTPTAVTAQAAYTVTASNSAGSTTAVVTIAVNKALATLLDLGHSAQIKLLRTTTTRVLSQDNSGHWALWDYTSGTELASGDQYFPGPSGAHTYPFYWPVDMAGQTVAIGQTNGLEVRSSSDGHLLSTIISPAMIDPTDSTVGNAWWKLASDGSYICAGSQAGLSVWAPTGQLLVSRQGDYSAANTFAAPGEVRVADGAAGENVVETISTSTGTSSIGPAFSGQFNSWFLDGERFLTNTGTAVWTYSKSSVQEAIVSFPTVENLTGQGNWVWTYASNTTGSPLAIYPVGGNSPAATYNLSASAAVIPSGTTIGVLSYGTAASSVIDLSGSTLSKADYTLPVAFLSAYAATSTSQWLAGNTHGVVLDGSSLSTTPRYLGLGIAWSISGAAGRAAVATASGKILYFDPALSTPQGAISFSSSKIVLSSDGTVLASAANATDAQYETDRTLNFYSLPANTLTTSIPYQFLQGTPNLYDFSLSSSGTMLGQVLGTYNGTTSTYVRQVAPVSGGPTVWSDNPPDPNNAIQLSPDGTLIAVSSGSGSSTSGTNILKNGLLVTAVPGWVVGWIDDNRVLVNNYAAYTNAYSNSAIYDATGTKLATTTLPELLRIQPVTSDQVYSPDRNAIYSLSTGLSTWTAADKSTGIGAVAGSYVVFASGSRVLVDSF